MTAEAERLLEALLDPCHATAELTGMLGIDPKLVRIKKPSNATHPWTVAVIEESDDHPTDEAAVYAPVSASGEGGKRWLIELVALSDPVPPSAPVRIALKQMMRSHCLKAVSLTSLAPDDSRTERQ